MQGAHAPTYGMAEAFERDLDGATRCGDNRASPAYSSGAGTNHDRIPMSKFDTRKFRNALGSFATGVAVVTARDEHGQPVGLTINSFASVSLDPPLVLWSLGLSTSTLEVFRNCSHYAINILAADQAALSQNFAQPGKGRTGEKFAGLEVCVGHGGAPLLQDCCAWFECSNETQHPGGDHLIFIGRVERFHQTQRPPLLFHGGQYRTLGEN